MSERDNLVPFERHRARRWTRASDYLPGADARSLLLSPAPGESPSGRAKPAKRRGLWFPIYALGIAATALWASGALDRSAPPTTAAAAAAGAVDAQAAGTTSSRGLVFGLCDDGGGTNCVVDGNSFYLQGRGVRLAGIDAPDTHSARCDAEALLGRAATERLQGLLNAGELTLVPVEPGTDANGRLLRQVKVDGQDVGASLAAAGLARSAEAGRSGWC